MDMTTMSGQLLVQLREIRSEPALLAFVVIVGLATGAGAGIWARRRQWRTTPAVLAGVGLTIIMAMTVAREPLSPQQLAGAPFCLVHDFAPLIDANADLNMVLFVPFAFFATVATGRAFAVLCCSVALTAAIELIQPIAGIGVCETQDFGNNALGAVVGVGTGWVLHRLLDARTSNGGLPSRR
jgi:hypothetical protein